MGKQEETPVPGDGWVMIEGGHYMLVPCGAERDENGNLWFETPCHLCAAVPGAFHEPDCPMGRGLYQLAEQCRDCGVALGKLHVMGCGIERCPRCCGQYMSCSCNGSEDAP
jgi:hypothetical protein